MTKNDALLPCPLPDCKDNKITRGYESGPMLYYVCCASPQHVLKVYGITQAFADERWNTRPTPPAAQISGMVEVSVDEWDEITRAATIEVNGNPFTNKECCKILQAVGRKIIGLRIVKDKA